MKHKLLILSLIIISLFTLKSLFHTGFFTSHDGEHQIVRLMHFHQGLVDGQFPVRWASTALDGNGYPLFVFTYRLPFWVAEVYYTLFPNLANAIKFAFIVSYLLSALTMYWFTFVISKNKIGAFFATLIYQIAPYRFVDIFVRAALGEAFTFIFLPTLFLSFYQLALSSKKRWIYILLLTTSLSAIILSHIMILILIIVPVLLWFLVLFLLSNQKRSLVFSAIIAVISTIGLTAYYWLPAFVERRFTLFSTILGTYYQDHFVTLKQLFYSKWGYGFSMPGNMDDMSFQLGLGQWLVVFLALIIILSILIKKIFKLKLLKVNYSPTKLALLAFCLLLFVYGLFMSTVYSQSFYQFINKIMVIDLPWKHLEITIFVVGLVGALIISIVKSVKHKLLIIIPIIAILFYNNRNYLRVNEYVYKTETEYWNNTSTSNQNDEYAPKDFLTYDDDKPKEVIPITGNATVKITNQEPYHLEFETNVTTPFVYLKTNVPLYPGWTSTIDGVEAKVEESQGSIIFNLPLGKHEVKLEWKEEQIMNIGGESENQLLSRKSNEFVFTSNVISDHADLVTKVVYYPGWQMYIDGQNKQIPLYRGHIAVPLVKGYHNIVLKYGNTPLRKFANLISFLSLVIIITLSFILWKNKKLS